MSLIHNHTCECAKSELDLFSTRPTQTSIEHGRSVFYQPLSALTDDSPIEFVIPGHGEEYLDLSQTMIYLKAKIVKQDGTSIKNEEKNQTGPINLWLHSLFSQIDVYMNQKLITPPNNTYPYRSYIETLLNYGRDAKDSHLTSSLWYTDTAGEFNMVEAGHNNGFDKRKDFITDSKCVDMMGHLHIDLFNQEKFMMNGVEMRVRLVRSKDSFNLMSSSPTGSFKSQIMEAALIVRRVKLNPSILLAHSKILSSTTAKYPITRVEMKAVTIPSGVLGKSLDNIFLGQLPKRIILGLVSNKAFNGDLKSNPFNFEHFNMNFMSLYVNGEQIPSKPLQPDFSKNKLYIRAYNTLFSGTGINFANEGNSISRNVYGDGFCLIAFDLTPDLSAHMTSHWNLIRHGSLRIEIGFSEATAETINCIIYAEFDNVIELDKNRNISVDFGS